MLRLYSEELFSNLAELLGIEARGELFEEGLLFVIEKSSIFSFVFSSL